MKAVCFFGCFIQLFKLIIDFNMDALSVHDYTELCQNNWFDKQN